MPQWYVVSVDLEETDPVVAREKGMYWCQWWIKNYQDSTKLPTQSCQFWPEVWKKDKDGVLGRLLVLQPDRCERFLERNGAKYGQYQDQVCLAEHLLVGPFNFEGKESAEATYGRQWRYWIHRDMWERLKVVGAERALEVKNIDEQAVVCIRVKPN